jgi:sigma-E factor negative regulatory protein RseC
MMTTTGRVINVAGPMAQVRIEPASGCSSCGSRGSCASGSARAVWVEAPQGTATGDLLRISIPEGALRSAALIGYLLPAVTTLFGAGITATAGDLAAVLGALAGLGLGLVLVRILGRRAAAADFSSACTTEHSTLSGDFS